MTSSQDHKNIINKISGSLADMLDPQRTALTFPENCDYPLLVLENDSDAAAFAATNVDPTNDFDTAYTTFKNLYRDRHEIWKDRNLSFVFCRPERKEANDVFFNSQEMDPYFCKKYVLEFFDDGDKLGRELQRLPFLPILEGSPGGIERPPPAQDLIQSIGVSPSLARQLILPRETGLEEFIAQLISGSDTLPPIGELSSLKNKAMAEPAEPTRLKSISIEGFRAYNEMHMFDLDADVIVLYGPNGLGKTSFFDAIDYVCTGRIGRLYKGGNHKRFKKIAHHLNAPADVGRVSIDVTQELSNKTIERTLDDWSHSFFDGKKQTRAKTLEFLTSRDWGEKTPRTENLENLFRATHLFSQSAPELLAEFQKTSALSTEIVSRTLSLEDYATGKKKADRILAQLEKDAKTDTSRREENEENVKKLQSEISLLAPPEKESNLGPQVKKLADQFLKDINVELETSVQETVLTEEGARDYRSLIEARLEEKREVSSVIELLISKFDAIVKKNGNLEKSKSKLKLLNDTIQKIRNEQLSLKEKELKCHDDLIRFKANLAESKEKEAQLGEWGRIHEIIRTKIDSLEKNTKELQRIKAASLSSEKELEKSRLHFKKTGSEIDEKQESLHKNEQHLNILNNIEKEIENWENTKTEIANLKRHIENLKTSLAEARSSIEKLTVAGAKQKKDLTAADREYETLALKYSNLTRLLDEIESYVIDERCPSCGATHESKAVLIEKIQAEKEARPDRIEKLVELRNDLRTNMHENEKDKELLLLEQEADESALESQKKDLSTKLDWIKDFANALEDAGFSPDDGDIRKKVSISVAHMTEIIESSKSAVSKLTSIHDEMSKGIQKLEIKSSEESTNRLAADEAVLSLNDEIAQLRSDIQALTLPQSIVISDIEAERKKHTDRQRGALDQIYALSEELRLITEKNTTNKSEISRLNHEINDTENTIETLKLEIEKYVASAVQVGWSDPKDLNQLKEKGEENADRIVVLEKLARKATTLETALNSARRTAKFAELNAQLQTASKTNTEIQERLSKISTVKKWVSKIGDILEKENSCAVEDHVKAFGPLTTVIQRRLRSVYGFEDIRLKPDGAKIDVEVNWGTATLKPTDYFSDSQKQILALSLFLASRLTQTWSGFAPILMDDPVTHFDDLNAFGFVEMIRGFVATTPRKRQFVISTCEERLFALMRKKFRGEGIFYEFKGIGADGPVISKL
jgi:exonuclease SbcC